MKLYSKCVYAIVDEDTLLRADHGHQPSTAISEGKPWSAVKNWLESNRHTNEQVPIVFADAKFVHRWLGWAVLTSVDVTPIDVPPPSRTRYHFRNLQPFLGHLRSEFRLLDQDRPLTEGHIRSYARFQTPPFLDELAERQGPLLSDWLGTTAAVAHVFQWAFPDEATRRDAVALLGRIIGIVTSTASPHWCTVLTPGRLRVIVGGDVIADVGARPGELLFVSDDQDVREAEDDYGLSLTDLFAKYESSFRRQVELRRGAPVSEFRHAPVVLEYLRGQGALEPSVATGQIGEVPAPSTPRSALDALGELFDPSDESDGRRRVLASLVRRRGQALFRGALLRAYGGRCSITGWAVEDVLEAAHILPYKGDHTNHVSNGLILRADLHTLFDLHLLKIDPETLAVVIDSTLSNTPYGEFHGRKLCVPADSSQGPSIECLRLHWQTPPT